MTRVRRAPAARAAGALVVVTLAVLALAVARADGNDVPGLPAESAVRIGLPPYAPTSLDPEEVERWAEAALVAGRERAGTRLGADLVLSAAAAFAILTDARARAAPLYDEAAGSYPRGDPAAAFASARAARLWLAAGDVAAARAATERLARWRGLVSEPGPVDASPTEAARAEAARRAAEELPRLVAEVASAEGRFAQAADAWEELATHPPPTDAAASIDPGEPWMRAAEARRRAGARDRASEDARRALDETADPRLRAQRTFWKVHLDHDALGEDGTVGVLEVWPGDAFLADVLAATRGLSGSPHLHPFLLTVASSALRAGRDDVAVDLYALVVNDPAFTEAARANPTLARALLPAFRAALGVRRLEEASRFLDVVERLGALPAAELDPWRARVTEASADLARERAEEERAARAAEAARALDEADPAARPRGSLTPPVADGTADDGDAHRDEERESEGSPLLPWIVAAVVAALVALLLRRAVGRRRTRG